MLHPRTTIRREGWYYLLILAVVFGGAMFKEVNLLLVLAGMMLGPVLLNWQAVAANLRGLRISRKLPIGLSAGDWMSVSLHLTNSRRRLGAWAVVVEEKIERQNAKTSRNHGDSSATLRPAVLFPYVAAGHSCKGQYRGRLTERGCYRFGPMQATTRFPFGLFSRTIAIGDAETLIVLPRLGRLTESWAARRQEAFAGADRRRRKPGADGDFYGVREWRPGDGRRLVYWRGSARRDNLVVRQFERPRSRDAAVVLDLWQPDSATENQRANVELAVSFAATVLADLCRHGGSGVCLALGESEQDCIGGPASASILQSMLERLAAAEAQSSDTLPQSLVNALQQVDAGAEIIVVGTRPLDMADTERFAAIWSDPALRDRMKRTRCVDASNESLEQYFRVE